MATQVFQSEISSCDLIMVRSFVPMQLGLTPTGAEFNQLEMERKIGEQNSHSVSSALETKQT